MYHTLLGNHTGPLGSSVILLVIATLLVQRKTFHHFCEINNVCIFYLVPSSKEFVLLEKIQRRATTFILGDFSSD